MELIEIADRITKIATAELVVALVEFATFVLIATIYIKGGKK